MTFIINTSLFTFYIIYLKPLHYSIEQSHFRNPERPRSPNEAVGGCSQVPFGPTETQHVAPNSQDGEKSLRKQPSVGFVEGSSSQCFGADRTKVQPERTQRGRSNEDGYVALRKDNSLSGGETRLMVLVKRDVLCSPLGK